MHGPYTRIHAELDDFIWSGENGRHPPLDTPEQKIACCSPFATKHRSQFRRFTVGCCLSRRPQCEVYSYTVSSSDSPKEINLEMSSLVIEGATGPLMKWSFLAVEQWRARLRRVSLNVICWDRGKSLIHSTAMILKQFSLLPIWDRGKSLIHSTAMILKQFSLLPITLSGITGKTKNLSGKFWLQ